MFTFRQVMFILLEFLLKKFLFQLNKLKTEIKLFKN